MKLSEVKGEAVLDLIADITEPVIKISKSDVVQNAFKKAVSAKPAEGESAENFHPSAIAMRELRDHVPELIRTNKREIVQVLAALQGCSVDEYLKDLNLLKLIVDVTEVLTDDGFSDFLTSQPETKQD